MTDKINISLTELRNLLGSGLICEKSPNFGDYYSVSQADLRKLAAHFNCPLIAAMIACLEIEIWPQRFCRNRGLLSAGEQIRLLRSHAAIFGCGGLGGLSIILLARLGLGGLTICDPDCFEDSNLNRQLLCREDCIGRNKALAAKEELALIASHAAVTAIQVPATAENLASLLHGVDIAVDCLDNFETRHLVTQAAQMAGIHFVHGAVAGQDGFVMLERSGGEGCFDKFYPKAKPDRAMNEQRLDAPTLTPAATSVLQCLLVCNALLDKNISLSDGLWHLDLAGLELERFFI